MSESEFSTWIFLVDGRHFALTRWVDARSAAELAREITLHPAAKIGVIVRVIITDGGDCIVFEWQRERGITFPPQCVTPTGKN